MRQQSRFLAHSQTDSLQANGLVRPDQAEQVFRLELFQPHPDLIPWIEYYWMVSWDLGAKTYIQTVITNPTIDLSLENDPATNGCDARLVLTGVVPKSYQRILRGKAKVIAAHFRPGMFRSWWGTPVHHLTGEVVFPGGGSQPWEAPLVKATAEILSLDLRESIKRLDAFLLNYLPPADPVGQEIRDLVQAARHDRELWEPDTMARLRSVSVRTNQRHFLDWVGVGPKWLTQRYRIQAALDILDQDRAQRTARGLRSAIDLTELAIRLGYYDHAHFTRDFSRLLGTSPDSYRNPIPDIPPPEEP